MTSEFIAWLVDTGDAYPVSDGQTLAALKRARKSITRPGPAKIRDYVVLAEHVTLHIHIPDGVVAFVWEIIELRGFVSDFYDSMLDECSMSTQEYEEVAETTGRHRAFTEVLEDICSIL